MLRDILRFNRDAKRALRAGLATELTLGDFIMGGGYGDELSRRYLLPMAAAIWSCPVGAMLRFPAASFLEFFENHGLLDLLDRPRWRTVTGGSQGVCEEVAGFLKRTRSPGHPGDLAEACRRLGSGLGFERGFLGL